MNQFEDELVEKGAAKRLEDGTLQINDISELEKSPFYQLNTIIVQRYMAFMHYPPDYILGMDEVEKLTSIWKDWVYRNGSDTNAEDQYKDLQAIGFLTSGGELSKSRVARAADYIWLRSTETPNHKALLEWVKKDMDKQFSAQGKKTNSILKKRKINRKRRKLGRRKK